MGRKDNVSLGEPHPPDPPPLPWPERPIPGCGGALQAQRPRAGPQHLITGEAVGGDELPGGPGELDDHRPALLGLTCVHQLDLDEPRPGGAPHGPQVPPRRTSRAHRLEGRPGPVEAVPGDRQPVPDHPVQLLRTVRRPITDQARDRVRIAPRDADQHARRPGGERSFGRDAEEIPGRSEGDQVGVGRQGHPERLAEPGRRFDGAPGRLRIAQLDRRVRPARRLQGVDLEDPAIHGIQQAPQVPAVPQPARQGGDRHRDGSHGLAHGPDEDRIIIQPRLRAVVVELELAHLDPSSSGVRHEALGEAGEALRQVGSLGEAVRRSVLPREAADADRQPHRLL